MHIVNLMAETIMDVRYSVVGFQDLTYSLNVFVAYLRFISFPNNFAIISGFDY